MVAVRQAPTLCVCGQSKITYPTMHAALAAQRDPQSGSTLIVNGNVMARCIGARWELQVDGISQLCWEYENA